MTTPPPDAVPTPALALAAARAATGRTPAEVRRFRTGTAHHVYEALFGDGRSAVVRMGTPAQRAGMAEGVRLNELLRPLGVPLPEVLAVGLDEPVPWAALERLPGTYVLFRSRRRSVQRCDVSCPTPHSAL